MFGKLSGILACLVIGSSSIGLHGAARGRGLCAPAIPGRVFHALLECGDPPAPRSLRRLPPESLAPVARGRG